MASSLPTSCVNLEQNTGWQGHIRLSAAEAHPQALSCMFAREMLLQHPCSDRHAVQVLVYHDLLGMMQHPHYVKVTPKFCKQYASVGTVIQEALQSYRDEVGHPPAILLKERIAGYLPESAPPS